MRRLIVFNQVTLDGYFTGEKGDLTWAHAPEIPDPEWKAFVAENASGEEELLFGRITYEMMVSYWPTPAALKNDPDVANGINAAPKVVFSKTLDKAEWNNTRVVKSDPVAEIRKMKQAPGAAMVIMGSGTIVARLADEGLVDEYQLVVIPVVLGKGRTMFEGVTKKLTMQPTRSRTFKNGRVVLWYAPAPQEAAPANRDEAGVRQTRESGQPVSTR